MNDETLDALLVSVSGDDLVRSSVPYSVVARVLTHYLSTLASEWQPSRSIWYASNSELLPVCRTVATLVLL